MHCIWQSKDIYFARLDANYVPLVRLKTDGVPLVHQPIHTAPPPTAPTGGISMPKLLVVAVETH